MKVMLIQSEAALLLMKLNPSVNSNFPSKLFVTDQLLSSIFVKIIPFFFNIDCNTVSPLGLITVAVKITDSP
jgi:hypothetical protein